MSEYLNDDEQVQALSRWWNENATTLIVGLLLVIGGVLGWRWYNDHTAANEEAASATYRQYLEVRNLATASAADRDAAVARLDTEFKKSGYRIFTLFYRAHDAADGKDYEKASFWLETALRDAGDDVLRDIARVRLARVQVQLVKVDDALATLGQVSGSGFRSYVAELKGDILVGQGKPAEALEAYQAAAAAADPDAENTVLDMKIVDLATPNAPAP